MIVSFLPGISGSDSAAQRAKFTIMYYVRAYHVVECTCAATHAHLAASAGSSRLYWDCPPSTLKISDFEIWPPSGTCIPRAHCYTIQPHPCTFLPLRQAYISGAPMYTYMLCLSSPAWFPTCIRHPSDCLSS